MGRAIQRIEAALLVEIEARSLGFLERIIVREARRAGLPKNAALELVTNQDECKFVRKVLALCKLKLSAYDEGTLITIVELLGTERGRNKAADFAMQALEKEEEVIQWVLKLLTSRLRTMPA